MSTPEHQLQAIIDDHLPAGHNMSLVNMIINKVEELYTIVMENELSVSI